MSFLYGVVFVWTVWAATLWAAIRIVDRDNPHNRFVMALVWSAAQVVIALVMQAAGLIGVAILVFWCMTLLRILMNQYELNLGRSMLVLLIVIVAPFGLDYLIVAIIRESLVLATIVFFGTPIAILGTWVWGRRRARRDAGADRIPMARATFHRKLPDPEPVVAPVVPSPSPAIAAPPIAAPPPVVEIPGRSPVAPIAVRAPVAEVNGEVNDRDPGEPTFLR